jgi:hypothetical protein
MRPHFAFAGVGIAPVERRPSAAVLFNVGRQTKASKAYLGDGAILAVLMTMSFTTSGMPKRNGDRTRGWC